jgi:hypothetical protein
MRLNGDRSMIGMQAGRYTAPMAADATLSIVSLAGVALGGAISFAAQLISQRTESRRHAAAVFEARLAERLTHLVAFLTAAQDAERIALERPASVGAEDEWRRRAADALDRLWTTEKTVHLLCEPKVTATAMRSPERFMTPFVATNRTMQCGRCYGRVDARSSMRHTSTWTARHSALHQ